MPSAFRSILVRQFSRPSGFAGALAGWVMATRRSNRQRNQRSVELLDIQPGDRVVEIGFGPGLALVWALERVGAGGAVGIDPSPVMHRQAARRNAAALHAGRLELRLGSVEDFPDLHGFDRALVVNVPGAWSNPPALERLLRLVKPGGLLALTYEPRGPGASDALARSAGARIRGELRAAGFEQVEVALIPLRPVAAVCVRARRANQPAGQDVGDPGQQRSAS